MKVYILGNLNGRVKAMVAANNLTEAAKLMGTTPHSMRQYGWNLAEGNAEKQALDSPGTVFYKKIMSFDDDPWGTDRYK